MNYPNTQYVKLISDLPKLIAAYNLNENSNLLSIGMLHDLHFKMYVNKNYPIDNKNVKIVNGERLFPIDESFLLYPERCNDNQIETAMRKAIKEIYN